MTKSCPSKFDRVQSIYKGFGFSEEQYILKIKACCSVFHHPQPLQQAPYPALCCPTRITSPDQRTTPVFCGLTRMSERSSAASLSLMIHCTRRRRLSMSVSQWPWVARWGPNSPLLKSPSWQTTTMVSGQSIELLLCGVLCKGLDFFFLKNLNFCWRYKDIRMCFDLIPVTPKGPTSTQECAIIQLF